MSTIQPTRPAAPVRKATKPQHGPKTFKQPTRHPAVRPEARQALDVPPQPRFPGRPLFGASNAIGKELQQPRNPLAVPIGLAAMPVALAVDVVDLITRPLQALIFTDWR